MMNNFTFAHRSPKNVLSNQHMFAFAFLVWATTAVYISRMFNRIGAFVCRRVLSTFAHGLYHSGYATGLGTILKPDGATCNIYFPAFLTNSFYFKRSGITFIATDGPITNKFATVKALCPSGVLIAFLAALSAKATIFWVGFMGITNFAKHIASKMSTSAGKSARCLGVQSHGGAYATNKKTDKLLRLDKNIITQA